MLWRGSGDVLDGVDGAARVVRGSVKVPREKPRRRGVNTFLDPWLMWGWATAKPRWGTRQKAGLT